MAYMDSYYRSFEDLLSRRFNATDEQIKTIIEKNREIKTNYVLQNIQSKLDLLSIFEVSLDEVCENPDFLLMRTNEIFARCNRCICCCKCRLFGASAIKSEILFAIFPRNSAAAAFVYVIIKKSSMLAGDTGSKI